MDLSSDDGADRRQNGQRTRAKGAALALLATACGIAFYSAQTRGDALSTLSSSSSHSSSIRAMASDGEASPSVRGALPDRSGRRRPRRVAEDSPPYLVEDKSFLASALESVGHDPDGECAGLNGKKCKKDRKCMLLGDVCVPKPTPETVDDVDATGEHCVAINSPRRCKADPACRYNRKVGVCHNRRVRPSGGGDATEEATTSATAAVTSAPATTSSSTTTTSGTVAATTVTTEETTAGTTTTTSTTTSTTTTTTATTTTERITPNNGGSANLQACPSGQCRSPEGRCEDTTMCFANPCATNPCGAGRACAANYCGGCHHTCSAVDERPGPPADGEDELPIDDAADEDQVKCAVGPAAASLGMEACPSSHFCQVGSGLCMPPHLVRHETTHFGLCEPKPDMCIEMYQPVCSCDGITYGNECKANAAGKSVSHDGDCAKVAADELDDGAATDPTVALGEDAMTKPATTISNPDPRPDGGAVSPAPQPQPAKCTIGPDADTDACASDEFCLVRTGICDAASPGMTTLHGKCAPVPRVCPMISDPICGCDGRTHGNTCIAGYHGVSVAHAGSCRHPPGFDPRDGKAQAGWADAEPEPADPVPRWATPPARTEPTLLDEPVFKMYQGPCSDDSHCEGGLVCHESSGECVCDTSNNGGCFPGKICSVPPDRECMLPDGCLPTCTCDYDSDAIDGSNGCAVGEVCRTGCAIADGGPECFASNNVRDCGIMGDNWMCRDSNGDGVIDKNDYSAGCVEILPIFPLLAEVSPESKDNPTGEVSASAATPTPQIASLPVMLEDPSAVDEVLYWYPSHEFNGHSFVPNCVESADEALNEYRFDTRAECCETFPEICSFGALASDAPEGSEAIAGECPEGQCLSPYSVCGSPFDCAAAADPCSSMLCEEGSICEINNCGGCYGTCSPTTSEAGAAEGKPAYWWPTAEVGGDCVYNAEYPDEYADTSLPLLSDTRDECCATYVCQDVDVAPKLEFWWPVGDADNGDCVYNSEYPDEYIDLLTSTREECCAIYTCHEENYMVHRLEHWWPVEEDGIRTCTYSSQYPDEYLTSSAAFVFNTKEECCTVYACSLPPKLELWFPFEDEDGERTCVYGTHYPDSYRTLAVPILFDTKDECCVTYEVVCNDDGIVPKEEYWWPVEEDGVQKCIYSSGYPDLFTHPQRPLVFDSVDECCKTMRACPRHFWYVTAEGEECVFGEDYPLHFIGGEDTLFQSKKECMKANVATGTSSTVAMVTATNRTASATETTAATTTSVMGTTTDAITSATETTATTTTFVMGTTTDSTTSVTQTIATTTTSVMSTTADTTTSTTERPATTMTSVMNTARDATTSAVATISTAISTTAAAITATNGTQKVITEPTLAAQMSTPSNCPWHRHMQVKNICTNSGKYPLVWDRLDLRDHMLYATAEECCEGAFSGDECVIEEHVCPHVLEFNVSENMTAIRDIPWDFGNPAEWKMDTNVSLHGDSSPSTSVTNIPIEGVSETSDLMLRFYAPQRAILRCQALIEVHMPFDYFVVTADGVVRYQYFEDSEGWTEIVTGFDKGYHKVTFSVVNANFEVNFDRGEDSGWYYGSGKVWLDQCELFGQ